MEKIDPDAVELPGWYRPNPGLGPRPGVRRVQLGRRRAGAQADHQLPVGVVGVRHRLDGRAGPQRHRLLPDAAAPPVRAAGEPRRRRRRRHPDRAVARAAARTGSSPRSASTASPSCPTPGRCCATSSTIPAFALQRQPPGAAVHRLGHADRVCGSGSSTRSRRPTSSSSSPPPTVRPCWPTCPAPRSAARAARCPAAARSNWPPTTPSDDLILEDDRGFVQVAEPNQVGVLLARPWGPIDPTASVKRGVFAAGRHLDLHRVPVPPRRRRRLLAARQPRAR